MIPLKKEKTAEEIHGELFWEAAFGIEEAYQYLVLISKLFRIWDDLWDGDRKVSKEDADDVFKKLTFDLSKNSFFAKNRAVLEAFIFLAWNAWQDSNEWKGSEDTVKGVCAWFIRDFCNEVVPLVAWLAGGTNHARTVSLKCREFYLKHLVGGGPDGFVKEG